MAGWEKHQPEDQVKEKEGKEKKSFLPTQKKVAGGKNYSDHNNLAYSRSFPSLADTTISGKKLLANLCCPYFPFYKIQARFHIFQM